MNHMEKLAEHLSTNELINWLQYALPSDIRSMLETTHPRSEVSDIKSTEGTLRAALWAVLRIRLPISWLVEAECRYPKSGSSKLDRADILVWPKIGNPIPFEVKKTLEGAAEDAKKVRRHVRMASSSVKFGILVFGSSADIFLPEDDGVIHIGIAGCVR
jgi:hypothetical protein